MTYFLQDTKINSYNFRILEKVYLTLGMGRPKGEKSRKERLFSKIIYLPRERMKEFEQMAEKDGTTKQEKTLASFIQRNVGNFSELVCELEDMKWQLEGLEKNMAKLKNKPEGWPHTLYARQEQIQKILDSVEWIKHPETGEALKTK